MKRASSEELRLLIELSRAIGVRAIYPPEHPSVAQAVERVLDALRTCTAAGAVDEITFLQLDGEVFLDERPIRSETLHLAPFVRTMERLGIQRMTLRSGLTVEEGRSLVDGLSRSEGWPEELEDSPHVDVGRVRITGTVGEDADGASSGAGEGDGDGAGRGLGEWALDRAERAFGGIAGRSAAGQAEGVEHLDELIWQLMDGLAATSRSFLLLSPIRSADHAFFVHSVHVALLALAQGRSLGLEGLMLHEVGMAAMLHDIGKLSLPRRLRERQGRLSDREWEQMKLHPELGAAWLAATEGAPRLALLVAYEHHLRWDGKPSFPLPSTPRTPNLASQITAVADTWDVLVSGRYPTPGSGRRAAIEVWRQRAGTWLDPFLVGNFVLLMSEVEEG